MAARDSSKILNSPPPDTARKILISTQTVVTKIKETITAAIANNLPQKELTEQLNKLISDYCNTLTDRALREESRKALVSSAKKWYFELSETVKILNHNLLLQNNGIYNISLFKRTNTGYIKEVRRLSTSGQNIGAPVVSDYREKMKIAIKALAAEPPKVVMISKGAAAGSTYIMPLRNRAEMAVRYEANMQDLERFKSSGVKLVWISSHPNCSPRCAQFQGKLYSLDGTSGIESGNRYVPIETALQGLNGDGNGCISGYNCRHRAIEYRPQSRPPADFTNKEIKKEYAIDKQQRNYENTIRQLKTEERLMRASGFSEEASLSRKRWRRLQLNYQAYSARNGRAFYPYRYIIDSVEEVKGESEDLSF